MWIKFLLFSILCLVLAVAQTSFLPYFSIMGKLPNLIFILFFIFIFFEEPLDSARGRPGSYYQGIFLACIAGFMLDALSSFYFGSSIVSLLLVYAMLKIMGHFLKEGAQRYFLLYFMPMFLVSLVFYDTVLYIITNFPHVTFTIPQSIFMDLLYNALVALIGFYIYKIINAGDSPDRQLKLFGR